MTNKIEILSPGPACWKTKKIIRSIKSILESHQVEYELKIITDWDLFTNYNTWILPTVVINNKIVARGYKPNEKEIFETIYQ